MTQDSQALGKTAGKDHAANKPTYVSVLGLSAAQAHARELHAAAMNALSRSGLADTNKLATLASRIVERTS